MDLELLLTMAVSFDEDRVAVSDLTGRRLTTGDLDSTSTGAAALFMASGADRVAYCDSNGVSLPVALFGAVKARMPFVPLNYRLADEQLHRILSDQRLVAVASGEQADRLGRLGVTEVIESSVFLDAASAAGAVAASSPIDVEDLALLLYTSGTTAAPKGVVLRHRHLAAYIINTVEFGSAAPDDSTLLSVPPYHIAGVMNLLSNLYMGRRIVYLDSFSAGRWLTAVRSEGITHAMVVPTMLSRVVAELAGKQADAPSLRTISYGGSKMPVSVISRALELFPDVDFTNAYGLTETSSTISLLGPDIHRQSFESEDPDTRARLGSAGLPLPGIEIEIRDDDGQPCATGASGNIFVRGEQVAGEYVGESASVGAWFATRDWGHLDLEGYLYVEGRSDDTIIRGGENISPAEIEEVLLSCDQVMDCAVVGIDDEEWGQRVAAAIVLIPEASIGTEGLKSFARERLRGSKTPDQIVVFGELPYTDTGKLLRRTVREWLATPG